jgi:hypothetical protein
VDETIGTWQDFTGAHRLCRVAASSHTTMAVEKGMDYCALRFA